jgi:hypothetical protein
LIGLFSSVPAIVKSRNGDCKNFLIASAASSWEIVVGLGLLATVSGLAQAETREEPASKPQPLVITHVTVIDMTGAKPQPDLRNVLF